MHAMTNQDPIITGAVNTGEIAGTLVAIHGGQIPRGYVRLHDNLVGAWDDLDEVKRALEIPYTLTEGPHAAVVGYPQGGNPRWLGLDVFDLQTDYHTRTGRDLPNLKVAEMLVGRCGELAVLLRSASIFKARRLPVRPARLDYDEKRIRSMTAQTEHGMLAVITLVKGETAWTPGLGFTSYRGPGNAHYLFTDDGVEAEFTREFD